MKKIAIFQTTLNIGGIEKSLVNLLNNIDLKENSIDLYLTSKENAYINDLNKNINIKYIKKLPYLTKLLPYKLVKLLYKVKIDDSYDIAIDFNSYAYETAIAAVKTKANKKIMWVHNDVIIKRKEEILYRILHFMFKKKYFEFDKFIAVSKPCLESFKTLNKLENKEYDVIPNIIDTKEIENKIKSKSIISVDKNKINICSTGRLVHQKGFDLLIEEINNIKDKLTNHHIYIIGGGSEEDKLKSLIKKYNLEDLISLTGYLDNPYSLMNEMDAFILMSRYEGQGMVILEAYSLGLDIIIPKRLEKYVDGIKGTDNISKSILSVEKKKHTFNNLSNYNNDIIDKLNNL